MKKLTLSLFIYSFLFLSFFQKAQASSVSFSVAPQITEIQIDTAKQIQIPIYLANLTDKPLSLSTKEAQLNVSGAHSEVKLLEKPDPDYSFLFSHLRFQDRTDNVQDIQLGPYEKKEIDIVLDLDQTVAPKDYYFTVLFRNIPTPIQNTTASSITAAIGTDILLSLGKRSTPIIDRKSVV